MSPAGFINIGRVVKPHGLKGEVAVITSVDVPFDSLVGIEVWFVPPPARLRTARISTARQGPKALLLGFDGVDDAALASELRGTEILANDADIEIAEEELEPDVTGFQVLDAARGNLGTVTDTIVTGANDVWVVDGPFGQVLIPVIDDVVKDIDEESQIIRVELLAGLIEEADA